VSVFVGWLFVLPPYDSRRFGEFSSPLTALYKAFRLSGYPVALLKRAQEQPEIRNRVKDFFIFLGEDMAAKINPLWDEFILWLATPENERGLITSEDDWAKAKGYSDSRTLRRWKKLPEFIERQRRLTETMVTKSGAVVVFEDDDNPDFADERDYRLVKAQLLTSAKGGNLKATELFMKLYGKTWIEEEQASRSSDFSSVDLGELVAQAAVAVAPEVLAEVLRASGWTVEEPDASAPRI
jgi:hypothetical protein